MNEVYVFTNNINGKRYVGVTSQFNMRVKQHMKPSNNLPFANALQKYGMDLFTVEHIPCPTIEEAYELEELMVGKEEVNSNMYYNLIEGGSGGTSPSLETRLKISKSLLGSKGHKWTKESRDKLSNSIKGIPKSEETKEKLRESNSKQYTFKAPEGHEVSFKGLRRFCHTMGLNRSCMVKVLNGKYKQHKGWTLPD